MNNGNIRITGTLRNGSTVNNGAIRIEGTLNELGAQ